MIFRCYEYPDIEIGTNAGYVQFVDGRYASHDPEVIAALKASRLPIYPDPEPLPKKKGK